VASIYKADRSAVTDFNDRFAATTRGRDSNISICECARQERLKINAFFGFAAML